MDIKILKTQHLEIMNGQPIHKENRIEYETPSKKIIKGETDGQKYMIVQRKTFFRKPKQVSFDLEKPPIQRTLTPYYPRNKTKHKKMKRVKTRKSRKN